MKKIVILHGWAYETAKWRTLIKALKSQDVDVELLKMPGLTTEINRPWTLDDYVHWLDEIIRKEQSKIILLGHSNGGRIALAYVLSHPSSIEHLILIDSAGIYHNELPIRIKRFIFKIIAKIGKRFTQSTKLRLVLYKLTHEQDYANASGYARETMRNMIKVDLTHALSTIKIPTLIIWGEDDVTTPLNDGRRMHRLLPSSELVVIQGARHSPQFTHVQQVRDVINKIL